MTIVTIYFAKHNDLILSFDSPRDNSYYYDTHLQMERLRDREESDLPRSPSQ